MKWLALLAAIVAAFFAIEILVADLRRGHERSTTAQLAAAVLSLTLLGVTIYAAHWLGFYTLPIVAFLFVPFGLALRWSTLATREIRQRREAPIPQIPPSRRDRFGGLVMWPVFLLLVALVACLGLLTAMLTARQ
jgi:hypothetical protein